MEIFVTFFQCCRDMETKSRHFLLSSLPKTFFFIFLYKQNILFCLWIKDLFLQNIFMKNILNYSFCLHFHCFQFVFMGGDAGAYIVEHFFCDIEHVAPII